MKKNGLFKVLSLALVLLITTVFAACKEDDDFGIAGTYHFDNPQDNKIKHRIDFKPDSTYAVTKSNINKSFTGTWSVSENVVTMTPYAEGIIVSPENFDASRDNDKVTLKLKSGQLSNVFTAFGAGAKDNIFLSSWTLTEGGGGLNPAIPESPASDFEYKIENGTVTIIKYIGNKTEIAIPNLIEGKPVTKIADGTCEYKNYISYTDYSPKSGAFMNVGVQNIVLPDTLTYLGACALYFTSARDIILPESLVTIGEYQDIIVSGGKKFVIPKNVTAIGRNFVKTEEHDGSVTLTIYCNVNDVSNRLSYDYYDYRNIIFTYNRSLFDLYKQNGAGIYTVNWKDSKSQNVYSPFE